MRSSSAITTQSLAVLLVGDPKSGKSSAMLGFPDLVVFDWDQNLGSAIRRTKTATSPDGVVFDFCQPAVDDNGKIIEPHNQWKQFTKELTTALTNPKYKTIAIDGLGLMCQALCEHIVAETRMAGSNKTGRMELQNYGDLARMLRATIMSIRSSGKTLVVTSHQTADKDDVSGVMRYYLAIPGQSKDTLGGTFTDVWAVIKKPHGLNDEKYELRTKADVRSVPLGASFDFPDKGALDITGKTPQDIWKILESKIKSK